MLTGGLAVALLAGCGGSDGDSDGPNKAAPTATVTTADHDPQTYAEELVDLTNAARVAEGLDPLAHSSCANDAALERARALVGEVELEHAPLEPVIRECAPVTTAAENLVNSEAAPADVLEAWLGSPGHRANIVDPALTEIGIGCVADRSKLLCSQVFLGP